jgi:hypothetical protein
MFAAPDVFASEKSLAHLTPHLREGARIVFFGSKVSRRRFGWLLNTALDFALTNFSLPSTPRMETEPWRLAARILEDFVVAEHFYGWMFMASGTFRGNPHVDD